MFQIFEIPLSFTLLRILPSNHFIQFAGSTIRQPLRPVQLVQPSSPVDDVHVDLGDGRRQHRESERIAPGGDRGVRDGGRPTAVGILELVLVIDHDRFVHEVRGCAKLLRDHARDTLLVEQQQSPHRRSSQPRFRDRRGRRHA